MQTSILAYYNVEAFRDHDKLVIQFMPEYRSQIEQRIEEAAIEKSSVAEVECLKFVPNPGQYLRIIMQKLEVPYSDVTVNWFLMQEWAELE